MRLWLRKIIVMVVNGYIYYVLEFIFILDNERVIGDFKIC